MKNILLIGGLGKIGRVLLDRLSGTYKFSVADVLGEPDGFDKPYCRVDASDYRALSASVRGDVDVLVNLAGLPYGPDLVDADTFLDMVRVYLTTSYNALLLARERDVKRVVLASSNHVTDSYERGGGSLLGRVITENDYPLTDGVYGSLKLCVESLAHSFTVNTDISVICLRIGTVVEDEISSLRENQRFHRTMLSHEDTAGLFQCAFEANVKFGVYYGVSDNAGRPWSLEKAKADLGYKPRRNSLDVLEGREP